MKPERTAAEYFGHRAAEYDSLIHRCVPRYEEMLERLVIYYPPTAERILELGCGTGNLSLRVQARYPQAELTLVDAAPEMLELASRRLHERDAAFAARTHAVERRFEDVAYPAASFDLVTSAMALHHIADKGAFFRGLRPQLRPGGMLVFADQMAGTTAVNHEINREHWLAFCRAPEACTEAEIASLIAHAAAHDHYESVPDHLRYLTDAGFADLDCVWRNWMWALITARAPAG